MKETPVFAPHDSIYKFVMDSVRGNLGAPGVHTPFHNREGLDDLISDLIQYRSKLADVDEYLKANKL